MGRQACRRVCPSFFCLCPDFFLRAQIRGDHLLAAKKMLMEAFSLIHSSLFSGTNRSESLCLDIESHTQTTDTQGYKHTQAHTSALSDQDNQPLLTPRAHTARDTRRRHMGTCMHTHACTLHTQLILPSFGREKRDRPSSRLTTDPSEHTNLFSLLSCLCLPLPPPLPILLLSPLKCFLKFF